jgi:hypothetical protein
MDCQEPCGKIFIGVAVAGEVVAGFTTEDTEGTEKNAERMEVNAVGKEDGTLLGTELRRSENPLQKNHVKIMVPAFLVQVALAVLPWAALGQAGAAAYAAMAPLDQYLIADQSAEIALARSAAPASIADGAAVMVLGREGYTTAVKGTNGFLCVVERGWGAATDDPVFWNPKIRGPICFNPAAARSFAPIYLMKTKLVLAGKSKAEIVAATGAALDSKELPALEPGAMCYMLSKEQYLSDTGKNWHPHLMFFVAGDAAKSWGADLPGSPVMAANDPQERVTIFLVWVGHWSDGTAGPAMGH